MTAITNWTITAPPSSGTNNGVFYPASGLTPENGNQVAYVFPGATGATCSITTTSSLGAIAANMLYTLTVALGNGGGNLSTFNTGTYTIELLANGTPVATNMLAGSAIPNGTFRDLSTVFSSPASGGVVGDALTIQLSATSGSTNDEGFFDNVRLTASPIPEPATVLLTGAGTAVLLLRRRLSQLLTRAEGPDRALR
ncbi:MAG: PEP-CTERM sorting domain-containing protein [Verrucomicrobia bacterium]|nr:PEP-CTERM sorting domain-containing protein [Verrucomicrobiota bacterium]